MKFSNYNTRKTDIVLQFIVSDIFIIIMDPNWSLKTFSFKVIFRGWHLHILLLFRFLGHNETSRFKNEHLKDK